MSVLTLPIAAALQTAAPIALAPRSFEEAWGAFYRLCVETLPDGAAFEAAMNSHGVRWRRAEQTEQEVFGVGLTWLSPIGMVTYRPWGVLGGPACHFGFVADAAYDHSVARRTVAAILGLPEGSDTGNRRAPQHRWESNVREGMRIRLFLSSGVDLPGGRGARLSISRIAFNPGPVRPDSGRER